MHYILQNNLIDISRPDLVGYDAVWCCGRTPTFQFMEHGSSLLRSEEPATGPSVQFWDHV
jgi:hypothetical protein